MQVAQFGEHIAQVEVKPGLAGLERDRLPVGLGRIGGPPQVLERHAAVAVGLGKGRPQLDGAVETGNGASRLPGGVEGHAQIAVILRVAAAHLHRPRNQADSGLCLALLQLDQAKQMVCGRMAGLLVQHAEIQRFGLGEAAGLMRRQALPHPVIEFACGCLGQDLPRLPCSWNNSL